MCRNEYSFLCVVRQWYVFLACTRPPNHAKVSSLLQSIGQDTMTRRLRLYLPNRVIHRVSVMLGHIQFLLTLIGLCCPRYTSDPSGLYIGDESGHMISKCVSSCCNSSIISFDSNVLLSFKPIYNGFWSLL